MDLIETDGIAVSFDPTGGIIDDVAIIGSGGHALHPLHKAPWVRNGDSLPSGIPLIERRLAGDFFCAPFAVSRPDIPLHGWTANGDWLRIGVDDAATGLYRLRQTVEGAGITKEIRLRPGHPIVYRTHTFHGGTGMIPIAHHAMLHVPGGARLSFSRKAFGRTGPAAPETNPAAGRSILSYPQAFSSLSCVRLADGRDADLTFYPFDTQHEDVVVLSEISSTDFGWSAAVAARDGFVFFGLKDARVLPQTVLWMSHGGRTYPPWNSRHSSVIGIEEAAVCFHLPEAQADQTGVATGLQLGSDRTSAIRYAFGAMPVPAGWTFIADIAMRSGHLVLTDTSGDWCALPFDSAFFNL